MHPNLLYFYYSHDIVPVVLGARQQDYLHMAPPGSYIYAHDFKSPKHLAEYLNFLDKNPKAYNQYFAWKTRGSFIDTKYYCRLCAMLHGLDENPVQKWYHLSKWWTVSNCTNARWDPKQMSQKIV